MVGWHHQLNGHEFEQPLGISEEQGSLGCCSPWGHKDSDVTEQLKNKTQYSQNKHQIHMGFGETHTYKKEKMLKCKIILCSVQFSRSVVSDSATP